MPDESQNDWREPQSPGEIELWTRQEIADVEKASELRIRELKELTRTYSAGEISAEEADALHSRYYARWPEALPGASTGPGVSDEQLLEKIDQQVERGKVGLRSRTEGRYR